MEQENGEVSVVEQTPIGIPTITFTREQIELIKRTVAKGTTDDELALFLHVARRTGLDPLTRQIHAVKRWDSSLGKDVMIPQVGIDGARLIAERTGKYVPGEEPTFAYNKEGRLLSATAHVKKFVAGEWHIVSTTAFFDEYAAKKKDGTLTMMWATKPHIMIAKCSEALALRKAFPAEMSGVYTTEEMGQADNPVAEAKPHIAEPVAKKPEATPEEKKEGPMTVTFVPVSRSVKKDKNGHDHYSIKSPEGVWYSTGNEHDGALCIDAGEKKQPIAIEYVMNGVFRNIVRVKLAEAGDAQEDNP